MLEFNELKIKSVLKPIVVKTYKAKEEEADLFSNTLDCFSCTIDALIQGITIEAWMEQEKARQSQKTLQNAIGDFHQKVLGTLDGVVDLQTGGIIDLEAKEKKIVAEVKNKWNTTKGNHKPNIYDDLEKVLRNYASDFVAYYVEILPKNGKRYNLPFCPSDNTTKVKRPTNERIRVIDGYSFYALMTGDEHALRKLYLKLPVIVCEILNEEFHLNRDYSKLDKQADFKEIFNKIFGDLS